MNKNREHSASAKDMLRKEMALYVQTIGSMTEREKKDLRDWVKSGNSVYDNPYFLYVDNGFPMDYINAIRINQEMMDEPDCFRWGQMEEAKSALGEDNDAPF